MFTDQQKNKLIYDMCFTTRHDFGLAKPDNARLSSGLTVSERMLLVQQMTQLVENCVIPAINDALANKPTV